ncbi:hypothetical protein [Lysobacter enzymogenes]|uniref:hypothetical protein n=1 Tax=Lysobacter enzymogenes TaxID=69 RepID=UPI001A965180|nr:hypothetical protein [Lysobacter enzymogenes]QQP97961.1 hypothetical protein JHW38_08145 [Lysobacter enzymogenes]
MDAGKVGRWTWPSRPTDPAGFEAMMVALDRHLGDQDVPLQERSGQAVSIVCAVFSVPNIIDLRRGPDRGQAYSDDDLAPRVLDWYAETYGGRLGDKNPLDVSVVRLNGSLWPISMPVVYGEARIVVRRELSSGQRGGLVYQRPQTINAVECIIGITPEFAKRLSDQDLDVLFDAFLEGHKASEYLHGLDGHPFFDQARGDYRHAVEELIDQRTLGKVRWDTAQCAEKVLKGLLGKAGHSFPTAGRKGHDIPHLGDLVNKHFGTALPEALLQAIDCPTGVRYGEIPTSLAVAYDAHRSLVKMLYELESKIRP